MTLVPKVRPVSNWRQILRHAWSVRFSALGLVCIGLDVAWPMLQGYLPISPILFAVLAGLFAVAAFIARIVAQKDI